MKLSQAGTFQYQDDLTNERRYNSNLAKAGKLLRYEGKLALVTLSGGALPLLLLLLSEKIPDRQCIKVGLFLVFLTLEEGCSSPRGQEGTSLGLESGRGLFSLPPPPARRGSKIRTSLLFTWSSVCQSM